MQALWMKFSNVILIVDMGASVCITHHHSDFITYQPSNIKIKDLSSTNRVKGEGILQWKVEDTKGNTVALDLKGYHIESAEVRLLSPQVLLATYGGEICQTTQCIQVSLTNRISVNTHFSPCSRLSYSRDTPKLAIQLCSGQALLLTWQIPWWKVNRFSVPQIQIFQLCRKNYFYCTNICLTPMLPVFKLSCEIENG